MGNGSLVEQDWLDFKWSWGWIWNSGVGVGIEVEISGVGIGVGVETSGVGVGVGVDILEICRSWSWSWNSRSWSWRWSWYSEDWAELELELELKPLELELELELSWYYGLDPNPGWHTLGWSLIICDLCQCGIRRSKQKCNGIYEIIFNAHIAMEFDWLGSLSNVKQYDFVPSPPLQTLWNHTEKKLISYGIKVEFRGGAPGARPS